MCIAAEDACNAMAAIGGPWQARSRTEHSDIWDLNKSRKIRSDKDSTENIDVAASLNGPWYPVVQRPDRVIILFRRVTSEQYFKTIILRLLLIRIYI